MDGIIAKIISGGQTGADRAALDFAIRHGLPYGGFCPLGRRAEDGRIPERYQLTECESTDYVERTERNVAAADATVIFSLGPQLSGGSRYTQYAAKKRGKPCLVLTPSLVDDIPDKLKSFLAANNVRILNVAGPRASHQPGIVEFVRETLEMALA